MKTAPNLPKFKVIELIEQARNAEICRDVESLQNILLQICDDLTDPPALPNCDVTLEAELLRLCGFYLTFYGRSRNLKDYHLKAKDLLTNSIELFQSAGLKDKYSEAQVILAFAYWNIGEVDNCEAILNLVEEEFSENRKDPVYVQIKINRIMTCCWTEKYSEALEIIKDVSSNIWFCEDLRLRIMFHNETGMVYQRVAGPGKKIFHYYDKAIFHFNEAIKLGESINNQYFVGLAYNNLALVNCDLEKFPEAHNFADKSLYLLKRNNHFGWVPHILDTKALIFLKENKFPEALEFADQSLKFFYEGEDYKGLIASLWTKTLCLFETGKGEDALASFTELYRIAGVSIGEIAQKKYAKALYDKIHYVPELPLRQQVAHFKKSRVRYGLVKNDLKIVKTARFLKLKSHQHLRNILDAEFPELYGELKLPPPKIRTSKQTAPPAEFRKVKVYNPRPQEQKITLRPDQILQEKKAISKLHFENARFSFDFDFAAETMKVFQFPKSLMKKFDVHYDALIAVSPISELKAGITVLVKRDNKFFAGVVEYEKNLNVYFIDNDADPIILESENVIGIPLGYCPGSEADKPIIHFSELKISE